MLFLSSSSTHTQTRTRAPAAFLRRWVIDGSVGGGGGGGGYSGMQCVVFHCVAPQVAKQAVEKWASPVSR